MMDGVIELPSQSDLPPGRTMKCMECGTRLRDGQPHTALQPRPHQTVSLLIAHVRVVDDEGISEYVHGSHLGITGYREPLRPTPPRSRGITEGRLVTGPLVQGPDLLWREMRG